MLNFSHVRLCGGQESLDHISSTYTDRPCFEENLTIDTFIEVVDRKRECKFGTRFTQMPQLWLQLANCNMFSRFQWQVGFCPSNNLGNLTQSITENNQPKLVL